MMDAKRLGFLLPKRMQNQLDAWLETLEVLTEIRERTAEARGGWHDLMGTRHRAKLLPPGPSARRG